MDYYHILIHSFYLFGLLALGLGIPRETRFAGDLENLFKENRNIRDDVAKRRMDDFQKNMQKGKEPVTPGQSGKAVLLAFSPTRIHAPPMMIA